jgi:3D (Asp-Asp-Asp) domain-containing protein
VRKRRFCITFENGREVNRVLERDWIAQEPQTRIIHYGTRIILRELATANGLRRYWRRLRAFATAYSPSTAGTPLDAPWFGITALGLRATKGIIAVDPKVIALTTNMYVPGYGQAIAGDTGSGIIGRWIDLCYDDDNLEAWAHWVDVYLLEPVPPADKIAWILPNWPVE